MNFFDVAFFCKICELGIEKTKQEFSLGDADIGETISAIQAFLGDPVFRDIDHPSVQNLTAKGRIFLPGAQKIIDDQLSCIIEDIEKVEGYECVVKMKTDILSGKNIASPSISRVESACIENPVKIELLTSEESDFNRFDSLYVHVMFHSIKRADRLMFEKRWCIKIEQGLYASKAYIHESGGMPQTVEDLNNHAILGIGDNFDKDVYSVTNWHLSEVYLGTSLTPAIMLSSPAVILAAIEANLGIGPLINYSPTLKNEKLIRIFPEIKGPSVVVEFAVRKKLSSDYLRVIEKLEREMLQEIGKLGLEVLY